MINIRVVDSEAAVERPCFLGHEDTANGKLGKALRNDTPIPTADGWRAVGDLEPGETVFTEEGLPTAVLGVYPQGVTDCWEVGFTTSDVIVASGDHLWTALDAVESKRRSRTDVLREEEGFEGWADTAPHTTLDLRDRLYHGAAYNWSIPVAGALELPDTSLPVDPYMLGVWLGDGSHKAPRISCHVGDEPVYAAEAKRAGIPWHSHYTESSKGNVVSVSMSGECTDGSLLRYRLKELGVWGNKHIPAVYLRASYAQRLELLRGLMDTDGAAVSKASRLASVGFSNERMACETRQLVASLGMKPARLARRPTAAKDHFTFVFGALVPVFKLPRKRDHGRLRGRASPQLLQRRIVSIDRAEDAETTCIRVANPSGLFLAGDAMIPTHNTAPGVLVPGPVHRDPRGGARDGHAARAGVEDGEGPHRVPSIGAAAAERARWRRWSGASSAAHSSTPASRRMRGRAAGARVRREIASSASPGGRPAVPGPSLRCCLPGSCRVRCWRPVVRTAAAGHPFPSRRWPFREHCHSWPGRHRWRCRLAADARRDGCRQGQKGADRPGRDGEAETRRVDGSGRAGREDPFCHVLVPGWRRAQ